MKRTPLLGIAAVLFGASLFGCHNTAEGAAQDTQQNTATVEKAADNAADATKKAADNAADATKKAANNAADATEKATANISDATTKAAKNTDAALSITPKVKLAISTDKELDDKRNTVNVDSKDNIVHLRGTVYSQHLKNKAGQIAEKALRDANATDTVSNELEVTPQ